jgi:hypothetical protein
MVPQNLGRRAELQIVPQEFDTHHIESIPFYIQVVSATINKDLDTINHKIMTKLEGGSKYENAPC